MEFFRVIRGDVFSVNDKQGDPVYVGQASPEDMMIAVGEYNAGVEDMALYLDKQAKRHKETGLHGLASAAELFAGEIRKRKVDETGSIPGEGGGSSSQSS